MYIQPICTTTKVNTMEIDLKNLKIVDKLIIPHIGITTFKYRAKAASILKKKNTDITIDHMIILRLLSIYGEMNQQEIAECIYKDKSNLSRMCDVLEHKGYLTRRLDLKNNRVVKVLNITSKGEEKVEQVMDIALKLHNAATKGITEEEIEILKSVTQKIRDNLNREIEGIE